MTIVVGGLLIMKVLIIGNGFDLAHCMPTKYTAFLCCAKKFYEYNNNTLMHADFGRFFAEKLKKHNLYSEFCEYEDNAWFVYLLNKKNEHELMGESWIDLEKEICKVISELEEVDFKENWPGAFFNERNRYQDLGNKFQKDKGDDWPSYEKHGIAISEFLFDELLKFVRAFEIYCVCLINSSVESYAKKHNLQSISNEMLKLKIDIINELYLNKEDAQMSHEEELLKYKTLQMKYTEQELVQLYAMNSKLSDLKVAEEKAITAYNEAVDRSNELARQHNSYCLMHFTFLYNCHYVLSFNYTKTFEFLYGNKTTRYCYIHGKAQEKTGNTNMVLGIEETLEGDDKNERFIFAKFKKYFQRIENGTGSEYKDWIRRMTENADQSHEIYILGHSLDVTDHEVLREFFNIKGDSVNTRITILYHDELSKTRLIEKTIKMIGKDELIRRVHGSDWTIRFMNQYDEELSIMQSSQKLSHSPCEDFWKVFEE
jgi:hypothetical protein